MKLWCEPCATTHAFSSADVERIVYALLGSDLDSKLSQRLDDPEEWCLRELLGASYNSEEYGPWVDVTIASRRGERRPRPERLRPALAATLAVSALAAAAVGFAVGQQASSQPGAALAALSPNSVGAIDPGSNALVASVRVGTRPTSVAAREGTVWVVNEGDATVSRIDAPKARVTGTIPAGAAVVAAGEDGVWALDDQGSLTRIDRGGEPPSPVARLDLGAIGPLETPALAVGGGQVWASGRGQVFGVSTDRPTRVAAIDADALAQDVAVGRDVWLLTRSTYHGVSPALRVDRATGAVLASVPIGLDPSAIALGEGSVWATASGSATLYRIEPRSGEITAAIRVGEAPSDVAIGAGAVWVANSGDGTVSRVDPRLNRVVATIPLGERPDGIAVGAGRVWVSVY